MFANRIQSMSQILRRGFLNNVNVKIDGKNINNCRTFIRKSVVEQSPKSNYVKTLFNGAVCGLAIGIGYTIYTSYKPKNAHLVHERTETFIIDKLPNFKITRKIVNTKDSTNLDLILFQYQTCPYCCKVRAFLDSMGFTYSIVEVDAVLRQDIKWSPYKKVPMLLARCKNGNYVQLTESSMIISALSSFLLDQSIDILDIVKYYPNISYMDNNGKKTSDVLNKYFCIYGEKAPKNLNKDELE